MIFDKHGKSCLTEDKVRQAKVRDVARRKFGSVLRTEPSNAGCGQARARRTQKMRLYHKNMTCISTK